MLVLKVNTGERVTLFHGGKEIGQVAFDRNPGCGQNSIRLMFDFEREIDIYRNTVIEKSDALRANLTFRDR